MFNKNVNLTKLHNIMAEYVGKSGIVFGTVIIGLQSNQYAFLFCSAFSGSCI